LAGRLGAFLRRLTDLGQQPKRETGPQRPLEPVGPVSPAVLVISYDPLVPSAGGHSLSRVLGWNRVDRLATDFVADLRQASHGYCHYRIVEQITVDAWPLKIDGYSYRPDEYMAAWRAGGGFHQPDWADYRRILADFQVVDRVESGQIDEVWLFAFPYGGFYESRMTGPGAFWCNAPPLDGVDGLSRRLVIMGFNYERDVGEMLESFGHRAESIMNRVFQDMRGDGDLWERFTRYDKQYPGRAEVGTVHFAPNSERDYDWGNRRPVPSNCDAWFNFPDLSGRPRQVDCREWGNGDTRKHHLWWFEHFPHVAGRSNGISHNWWAYVVDPNRVP
jgi:hypothetical protein